MGCEEAATLYDYNPRPVERRKTLGKHSLRMSSLFLLSGIWFLKMSIGTSYAWCSVTNQNLSLNLYVKSLSYLSRSLVDILPSTAKPCRNSYQTLLLKGTSPPVISSTNFGSGSYNITWKCSTACIDLSVFQFLNQITCYTRARISH